MILSLRQTPGSPGVFLDASLAQQEEAAAKLFVGGLG